MAKPPLNGVAETEYTKSHLRGLSSLLKNSLRVHELVAGSSAWQVRATKDKAKVGGFIAPHSFMLPRVRTYHTRKPSRFAHALSARLLDNGWRGRRSDTYADGTIKINPISLCSHADFCQKLNREICHSLIWHSGESESALKRFEPVAVAKLQWDGRGTLFALVAARRRKVFKRGRKALLNDFCRAFGHAKAR